MKSEAQKPASARVTLQSIAERVGVSRMTVSNAFSKPDQLSSSLRERILAAADELGYSGPDPAARALARGSSGAIGVVLTDSLSHAFTDAVPTAFLAAVAAELEPAGVAMTLISLPRASTRPPPGDVALDGAIIYSVDGDSPVLPWLRRRHLPLVLVDQRPDATSPTVNVDDRGGARAVAEHIVGLGHRAVGIIIEGMSAPYDQLVDAAAGTVHYVIAERLAGWLDPLRTAGVEPSIVNLYRNGLEEGRRAADLLLDIQPRPTALICLSDLLAMGALAAVEARGLRVPHDVSVVGFDDSPMAAHTRPALTTVRQPTNQKGRMAAQALLALIDARESDSPQHHLLAAELVIRNSSAPPPTDATPR